MDRREVVVQSLDDCVSRLDVVFHPWGFLFESDVCHSSHTGPYASGHYVRDATRIGLSCRDAIDNIYYEQSFVTQCDSYREIETFTISHTGLMRDLHQADDCQLIDTADIPGAIVARDGGDPVDALLYDLANFAAPILAEPSDEFCKIIRCGFRGYRVE